MTWETFYLICFVVGLIFSLLSVLGSFGKFHFPARWHLPHFLGHHAAPMHAPPVPVHATGAGHHLGAIHRGAAGARGSQVSFFNFSSLMAFLAWFGGTGYLLTRYSNLWTAAAFGVALASGLLAATIVFLFLVKVLLAHETELDPADFDLVGMLGRVNVAIRAGGTGEIIFSQGGSRHAAGARSEEGAAIEKGTEVVVTRYEKGIAYVRRWDDMAGERNEAARAGGQKA
jgi:membrane protein implicated in regulation of membrane protease activity